jgi:hypothetical protein
MREAYRVLAPAGWLVIGLIDRESPLGNQTIFREPNGMDVPDPVREGCGEGSVVVRADQ